MTARACGVRESGLGDPRTCRTLNGSELTVETIRRLACEAEISEGAGSRVRVALNGMRAVFHRPPPQKETDKGAIKSVRRFLSEAGIRP